MWVKYRNGNYNVMLNLNDGTKIRYNDEDKLIPNRPESMDVKITNKCMYNCSFCHENSNPFGQKVSYSTLNNFAFSLPPYTEIACGGGSLMFDPTHTEYFLMRLKEAKAIPSITLHQKDFIAYQKIVESWVNNKLVYGIGVSVDDPHNSELHKLLSKYSNAVIHTIGGMYSSEYYKMLFDRNYKILFLGYKKFRRGKRFYQNNQDKIENNMQWLEDNILDFHNHFTVVSFDNLALEQLHMKDKLSQEQWNKYYCGDDGSFTFYVDLVEEQFAKNSTSTKRFPIENKSVIEMFNHIRSLDD